MKKESVFFTSTILVSLILVLASCGTNSTTTSAPATTSSRPATTMAATATSKPASEEPKYGGIFTNFVAADTAAFDASTQFDLLGFQISLGNEALLTGDWAKGPAGTGETDWTGNHMGNTKLLGGWLAESYEVVDPETIIFHLREGVRWWDKPPANGREFTADDVVWNLETQWANQGGNFNFFFPSPEEKLVSVRAIDRYTVEEKFHPYHQGIHLLESGCRAYMMLPELYPDQTDWKNALGTGAYMLTDYVSATSLTFTKNQNYYGVDPVGPGKGNQLPYMDGLKILVIPDISTQQAAFRTGKIETLANLPPEDFNELQKSTRWDFEYKIGQGNNALPTGREDKDLPFNDIRVRQAMNLAVDKVAIAEDYYMGQADLLGYPYPDSKALAHLYTPMEELPEYVQELVKGGNPEKAKQLLADAGYPNGFKTKIGCQSVDADLMSIIKQDLSKVGIDMEIQVFEPGTYRNVDRQRSWDEMWLKWAKQTWLPHYCFEWRPESNDSAAFWDSPETREVYNEIQKWLGIDDTKWIEPLKAVTPFVLESSFAIWMPSPYRYQVWQPWLKNYFGASSQNAFTPFHYTYHTWLDTDLKAQIMGK